MLALLLSLVSTSDICLHNTQYALLSLTLGDLYSSLLQDSLAVGSQIYDGIRQILSVMQLFVLGPRLILGVRQYHANTLDNSDAGADMISMSFRERTYVSTGSDV